jgi:hypothetical protein
MRPLTFASIVGFVRIRCLRLAHARPRPSPATSPTLALALRPSPTGGSTASATEATTAEPQRPPPQHDHLVPTPPSPTATAVPPLPAGWLAWQGNNNSFYFFNKDGTWSWDSDGQKCQSENQGRWWIRAACHAQGLKARACVGKSRLGWLSRGTARGSSQRSASCASGNPNLPARPPKRESNTFGWRALRRLLRFVDWKSSPAGRAPCLPTG